MVLTFLVLTSGLFAQNRDKEGESNGNNPPDLSLISPPLTPPVNDPDSDDGDHARPCGIKPPNFRDYVMLRVHHKSDVATISFTPDMPDLHLAIYQVPESADPTDLDELDLLFLSEGHTKFDAMNQKCGSDFLYQVKISFPIYDIIKNLTDCSHAGKFDEIRSTQLLYALVDDDVKPNPDFYPVKRHPNYFSCLTSSAHPSTLINYRYCCEGTGEDDPDDDGGTKDEDGNNDSSGRSLNVMHDVQIAPSPFSDMLHINLNEKADIEIYNSNGKIMFSTQASRQQIHTSDWLSGIYFVRIKRGGEIEMRKILKL